MKDPKLSRRGVFGLGGGAALAAVAASSAKAAVTEIEDMRAKIGVRVSLSNEQGASEAELEKVVELGPHVRPPFEFAHRRPFSLVFRVEDPAMDGGTYQVASSAGLPEVMMMTLDAGEDGVTRLEAVFN